MSEVVDHLAELTGLRDRDVLDVTLVGAFRDLLRPDSVTIYRPVGEAGAQHWLTRARLNADDAAPSADSLWSDLDDLPALQTLPEHQRCLSLQTAACAQTHGQFISLFPLTTDRVGSGVLDIRTAAPLSAEQTRLVTSMLRVYRNFHGLLDDSERDPLTGLLNRKTFDGFFLRVAARSPGDAATGNGVDDRRVRTEAGWLGLVDLDHFKAVNDTHGHLIGDEVLLLTARLLRSSFRFQDQLYRFGGEEFVVLMRGGDAEQAVQAFDRLRVNVSAHVFPRVGRITVSVGVTELRLGDSPSSAFERADRALYHAKQQGRNRVAHHRELIARGMLKDAARIGDVELF